MKQARRLFGLRAQFVRTPQTVKIGSGAGSAAAVKPERLHTGLFTAFF